MKQLDIIHMGERPYKKVLKACRETNNLRTPLANSVIPSWRYRLWDSTIRSCRFATEIHPACTVHDRTSLLGAMQQESIGGETGCDHKLLCSTSHIHFVNLSVTFEQKHEVARIYTIIVASIITTWKSSTFRCTLAVNESMSQKR